MPRIPGQLERESQNVKTFNQALWHAQNGSDDLAILQLARVVESNPHFVKAHLLLALLYMSREDYNKAGRSLYKILQIDKSNQKALYYMSIVKQNTGRADAEKRKMVKAFSHRQMEDDDVIIPNSYKESTGSPAVINGINAFLFSNTFCILFIEFHPPVSCNCRNVLISPAAGSPGSEERSARLRWWHC